MQSAVPKPSDPPSFLRPEGEVAIKELCESLESTRSLLDERMGQGELEYTEFDSLPQERRSLAFVQAVFKHTFSPSDIGDAIAALKDFQFGVESCQQTTDIASRQFWRLYDIVKNRTLQRRASMIFTSSTIPESSTRLKATTSFRKEILNSIKVHGVASKAQTGRGARAGTSAEENTSTPKDQPIAISSNQRLSKKRTRGFWGLSKHRQTTK